MTDRRPVLLGMNNPLHVDPKYALYPAPVGCTGYRIWQLLKSRVPEVTRIDYINTFDRRNLVDGVTWDAGMARENARRLSSLLRGRVAVTLGTTVRVALGLPELLIHPQEIDGVTWRQLPHPSGRNLWFNNETNRSLAAMLLESLYLEYKGERYD